MRARRLDVHQTRGGVRIGTESKVGWVRDSRFYREQLTKDLALLEQGRIDKIRWDFRRSYITGEIGADPTFLARITRAKNRGLDIDYRFLD